MVLNWHHSRLDLYWIQSGVNLTPEFLQCSNLYTKQSDCEDLPAAKLLDFEYRSSKGNYKRNKNKNKKHIWKVVFFFFIFYFSFFFFFIYINDNILIWQKAAALASRNYCLPYISNLDTLVVCIVHITSIPSAYTFLARESLIHSRHVGLHL